MLKMTERMSLLKNGCVIHIGDTSTNGRCGMSWPTSYVNIFGEHFCNITHFIKMNKIVTGVY